MSKKRKRVASKELMTGEVVKVPVIDIFNAINQLQQEPSVLTYTALVRMLELRESKG